MIYYEPEVVNGMGNILSSLGLFWAIIVIAAGFVSFFISYLCSDKKIEKYINKRTEYYKTSVYKGYKQDKIEMRGDRAEMSDFPLYLNTVAGGLDRRDQTIGGFSFVVKIYALPVVEIIGQLLYLLGRYGFNAQFGDCL